MKVVYSKGSRLLLGLLAFLSLSENSILLKNVYACGGSKGARSPRVADSFKVVVSPRAISMGQPNEYADEHGDSSAQGNFYRLLSPPLNEPFVILDQDETIVEANLAASELFGADSSHLVGKPFKSYFSGRICAFTSSNSPLQEGHYFTVFRENGTEVPVSTRVLSMERQGRNYFGVMLRDVSGDLAKMKRPLSDSLEPNEQAVRDALANMCHEVRNPLKGVSGVIDILLNSEISDEHRDELLTARGSLDYALEVMNRSIDFAKFQSGQFELESIRFSPEELVAETIRITKVSAQQKGIRMEPVIDPTIPQSIIGDPVRLKQVLINLIGNAIKFTPDHGLVQVRVRRLVASSSSALRLALTGSLVFEVKDSGIGMRPEELERIFTPYRQANSETTRKYGGTGLGLSISKILIEKMGGMISVESVFGQGSSFWFKIPYSLTAFQSTPSSSTRTLHERKESESVIRDSARERHSHFRVLVTDDNDVNRKIIAKMLIGAGFNVETAADGNEALLKLFAINSLDELQEGKQYAGNYDVVLMDHSMAGMDGIAAAQMIRKYEDPTKSIKIIACTGNTLPGSKELYRKAGMDDYVVAPIERRTLINTIMNLISSRE